MWHGVRRRAIKSPTEPLVDEEPDVTSRYPGILIEKGKSWAGDSESEKYPISSVDSSAVYQAGIGQIRRLLAGHNIFFLAQKCLGIQTPNHVKAFNDISWSFRPAFVNNLLCLIWGEI